MDWIGVGLVAVICLVIGFLAATLLGGLRNGSPAPPEADAPESDDRVEVLRMLRPLGGGSLQVEMGGKTLNSAAKLNADQHAQVSMAMVDLYAWLEEGNQPPPKLEKPLSPPSTVPAEQGESRTKKPVKAPTLNVFKALARTAKKEVTEKIEVAPLSLAAEIDDILQEKLEGSPQEERGIRLMDLPNQGMVIMIGLEKFTDVEAVPDEAIRGLLNEAVAEWEARTKGEGRPE
jgi:hypothetical protein